MVKWNRRNPRLIASVHDGEVFIWDVRKESAPITKIMAHKQISSMDWSYHSECELVTSSTDRTVKFWDYQKPSICQAILQTGNPVSKVKYTPFGRAIITISQRADFTVRMWNLSDLEQPVYQFMGHKDVVSSLDWRTCDVGEDYEYQLLSWSKDSNLRFWPIDINLINTMQSRDSYGAGRSTLPSTSTSFANKEGFGSSLGIYPSVGVAGSSLASTESRDLQSTPNNSTMNAALAGSPRRVGAHLSSLSASNPANLSPFSTTNHSSSVSNLSSLSPSPVSSSTIANLEQELAILQRRPIQGVIIEEASLSQRTLTLRLGRLPYLMRLKITFPSLYPHLASPAFEFITITEQEVRQLLGLGTQSPQTTASLLAGPSKLSEEEKLCLKVKAKQLLVKVAYAFVSINLVCVDPCCTQLLEQLESFHADPKLVLVPEDDPDKELPFKPEEYYRSYSLSSGSVPSTPSSRSGDSNSQNNDSTFNSGSLGKERIIPRLTFSESSTGSGATSTVTQIAFSPPIATPGAMSNSKQGYDAHGQLPKTKSDMNLSRFLDNEYLGGNNSPSSSTGARMHPGQLSTSTSTAPSNPTASNQSTTANNTNNTSNTSISTGPGPTTSTGTKNPLSSTSGATSGLSPSTDPSSSKEESATGQGGSANTLTTTAGGATTSSNTSGTSSTAPTSSNPTSPHPTTEAIKTLTESPSAGSISLSANATANFGNTSVPATTTGASTLGSISSAGVSSTQQSSTLRSGTLPGASIPPAGSKLSASALPRSHRSEDDLKSQTSLRESTDSFYTVDADDSDFRVAHTLENDEHLSNPIPAPRTCGAFFYSTGLLCIFGAKQKALPSGSIPTGQLATHARTYPEFLEVIKATSSAQRSLSTNGSGKGNNLGAVRASHDAISGYEEHAFELDMDLDASESANTSTSSKIHRAVSMSAMSAMGDSETGSESGIDDTATNPSSAATSSSLTKAAPSLQGRHGAASMLHKVSSEANFSSLQYAVSSSSAMSRLPSKQESRRASTISQHHGRLARKDPSRRGDIRVEWRDCILIHDLSMLIPVSPVLARLYTLSGASTPSAIAQLNTLAAKSVRRMDAAKLWSLVEAQLHPSVYPGTRYDSQQDSSMSGSNNNRLAMLTGGVNSKIPSFSSSSAFDLTWAMHPLGRKLLQSFFKRFEQLGDVQTLAILSCVISGPMTPYGVDHIFPAAVKRPLSLMPHKLHHQRSSSLTLPQLTSNANNFGSLSQLPSLGPISGPSSQNTGPLSSNSSSPHSSGPIHAVSGGVLGSSTFMPNTSSLMGQGVNKALAMSHIGLARDRSSNAHGESSSGSTGTFSLSERSSSAAFASSSSIGMAPTQSGSSSWQQGQVQGSHGPGARGNVGFHSSVSSPIASSHAHAASTAEYSQLANSLVEYENLRTYNKYRRVYADILYLWGEFTGRAEVLKYVADPTPPNDGIDFVILCQRCSKPLKTPYCQSCKIYGFDCDICHLRVKGLSSFCLKCGHGGHADHLRKWFEKERVCPAGCGCECMGTDGHF